VNAVTFAFPRALDFQFGQMLDRVRHGLRWRWRRLSKLLGPAGSRAAEPVPRAIATDLQTFEGRRKHAHFKLQHNVPDYARRGRFLDIGCGTGNGVVAALQHGFDKAVGIDINLSEFAWFHPDEYPAICRHYGVNPAQATLIEGDIFKTDRLRPASFDTVFMLDSIEHVPDPAAFINVAAKYVKPGGVLLVDTCPLYYSIDGHHLFRPEQFPPDTHPWVHFRRDFMELVAAKSIHPWSWDRFLELNKVTHSAIRTAMEGAGLEIVEEHRDQPTQENLDLLEATRPLLNLQGIDEATLFEHWVLLVGRKA
jgi:SAM-dependent methyltransferase